MDIKTLLENLREEVSCSVCSDIFTDPKHLPCLHSFCLKCLKRWHNKSHGRDTIRCPNCQAVSRIPKSGDLKDLPTSFYLNGLIDVLAIKECRSSQVSCGNCGKKSSETSYCFQCCVFWCEECVTGHNMRNNMDHRVLALKDFKDKDYEDVLRRPVFCAKQRHEKKELEFFCKNCETAVCQTCVLMDHPGHALEHIEEEAERQKIEMKSMIERQRLNLQAKMNTVIQLNEDYAKLVQQGEDVKREIQRMFDTVMAFLEAKKQNMFAAIETETKKSLESVTREETKIEHQIEVTKLSLVKADEVLTRSTNAEAAQLKKSLETILEEIDPSEPTDHDAKAFPILVFVENQKMSETFNAEEIGTLEISYPTLASQSVAEGNGLGKGIAGGEAEFVLTTRDSEATKIVQKTEEEDSEEEEEEVEVGSEDETDTIFPINDNKKTLTRSCMCCVSCEGDTWSIKEAAALITFHRGTVKKPLLITCSLWSPWRLSPLLGSNELLVSNVIELSNDGPPDLELNGDASKGDISVALLHSASNLKGYEVVIKQLVDLENNIWKDLKTENIWHTSANPSAPKWLFPFAEATCTITRHSSFAAIWRLKSFIFPKPKSVTPEFTCVVPDYPDVSITIPWNSVPTTEDYCITVKFQEAPSIGPNREGMLVGPILHVSGSHNIALLEPAKISIPLTLFEGNRELADLSSGQWRILHYSSKESQEWTESTDQLEMPPVVIDGIVTFQVKHFCRIWLLWFAQPLDDPRNFASDLYTRVMRQHPGFSAFLCDEGNDERPTDYLLTVSCFPLHLKHQVNSAMPEAAHYQGYKTSLKPLCAGDLVSVSLSEQFLVRHGGYTEDLYLMFLGDAPFYKSWPVSVPVVRNLRITFLEIQNDQGSIEELCTLFIIPRFPQQENQQKKFSCNKAVKEGTPEDVDLERLAQKIPHHWKKLGRRLLENDEAALNAIDKENDDYYEKAYQMFLRWKQAKGLAATYRVLYDSLCHDLVKRRDLAQFCLVDNS